MKKFTYHDAQVNFIYANANDFTVKELSESLGLPVQTINNIGIKYGLTFKKKYNVKPIQNAIPRPKAVVIGPAPEKKKFERVKGEYSNHSPWGIASDYLEGK